MRRETIVRHVKLAVGFIAALNLATAAAQAETGPFSGYQGSWTGSGTIATTNGSERIRCRASYAVDGSGVSLRQNLTCASDSYKFQVMSDVIAQGGRLSGSWSETTRNATGSLSGTVADGKFRANVAAGVFNAGISVDASPNRQTVTITPRGVDIQRVSVVLQR